MSSPTPSTIENVIHSGASSPHEYSLAAPLTATDLQQVLEQFPDPTQSPDRDDSLAPPEPITSGLDIDEPMVVRTLTPAELVPYMVNLSDYSPMRTDNSEVRLSCTPEGPHCAELDQPRLQSAAHSAKNQAGPPTDASVARKPKPQKSPRTSPRETRPSTVWGQYIRTQGGRLRDSAYPASSGQKKKTRKGTTKTVAAKKTTTTTKIPSQFQPWDVQLQRTQKLIGDSERLTRIQARRLAQRLPRRQDSS